MDGLRGHCPLFLPPTRSASLLSHKPQCFQSTNLRRPVQARLNTAAKSLVVAAALLCIPLIPKFHHRVPTAYRRSAPHVVAIALVAAGLASRTDKPVLLSVKRPRPDREPEEHELVPENGDIRTGEHVDDFGQKTELPLREAFSSSRAEWGDEAKPRGSWKASGERQTQSESTYSYSFKSSRKTVTEKKTTAPESRSTFDRAMDVRGDYSDKTKDEGLKVVSGGELMKTFANFPVYVLREVVVPVCEVGSVLWYDLKMAVLDGLVRRDGRYFMNNGNVGTEEYVEVNEGEGMEEMEEEMSRENLSLEEQQVLEMQRSAMRAARDVEKVTKKMQGTVVRLLGRIF